MAKRKSSQSQRSKKKPKLENAREEEKEQAKAFNKGAIVRVKLHNFVTYDDVEFFPEAGLNLIVGPNGTGKSSVICALCLGLGGSTSSLGRADHVKDYVKRGKKRGYTEIELYQVTGRENCTIRRNIDIENNTEWFVNGRRCRKKEVSEVTESLNIKVDNLCQFLAQERVVNFAKQTPTELLLQTEKAVEDSVLHDIHMRLIKLRKDEIKHVESVQDINERLERLNKQQEEAQRDQLRFKMQEELREYIKHLKKKRPWADFDRCNTQYKEAKKVYNKAKQEYNSQRDTKPLKDELQGLEREWQGIHEDEHKNKTTFKKLDTKRNAFGTELDELEEKVEDLKLKETSCQRQIAKLNETKRLLESKISEGQQHRANLPSIRDVETKMGEIRDRMNQIRRENQGIQRKIEDIVQAINGIKREEREQRRRLTDLNNVKLMREQKLFANVPNARKMYEYVEAHRGEFGGDIYGPIARECEVQNTLQADYLDNHVPFAIKFGYVVSNGSDWEKLKNLAKRYNVYCTIIESGKIPTPPRRGDLSYLSQFGVTNWLDEVVGCPDPVKAVLYDHTSIHIAAIAERVLQPQEIENALAQRVDDRRGCYVLYTPQENHRVKFSYYGDRAKSVGVTQMKKAKFFTAGVDDKDKEVVEKELKKLEEKRSELEAEKKEVGAKQHPLDEAHHKLLNEMRDCKKKLKEIKRIEAKIKNYTDRLRELPSQDSLLKEIVAHKKAIKRTNSERVQRILRIRVLFTNWVNSAIERDTLVISKRRLTIQMDELKLRIERIEQVADQFKRAMKQAETDAKRHKLEKDKKKAIANQEAPMAQYRDVFEKIEEDTVDEIDTAVIKKEAQLNALVVDVGAVRRFQTREKEIKDLGEKQLKRQEIQDSKRKEIEKLKGKWLPKLKDMVEKVNVVYAKFFEEIGCQGQIKLHEDDNFDKYALEISVQFRKDIPLKKLSASAQSGGERSVATMLYLLCLQEVTTCPFRVVDEINQGMDPSNERMIFNQVVQCSSRQNSPQYFMVTPKLLPDLNYTSNVTMFIVFNGPWQVPQNQWDVKGMLTQRSQRSQ